MDGKEQKSDVMTWFGDGKFVLKIICEGRQLSTFDIIPHKNQLILGQWLKDMALVQGPGPAKAAQQVQYLVEDTRTRSETDMAL